MIIKIDNISYKVGMLSLKREFNIEEKYNVTTEDGVKHREIRGIYNNYTLQLGNINEDTYDELMDALTSGKEYQAVEIPDGKDGFKTFEAMFSSISDELVRERNGIRHWDNLSIKFMARSPI